MDDSIAELNEYLWSLTDEELQKVFAEIMHHMKMRSVAKVPLRDLTAQALADPESMARYFLEYISEDSSSIEAGLKRRKSSKA